MVIYAYDDYRRWGKTFQLANSNVLLFRALDELPEDAVVFFPVGHAREYRWKLKAIAEEVNKVAKIWPNIHEIRVYDDKIAQYKAYGEWFPKTWIVTSEEEAREALSEIKYPFISKGNEGSGCKNNDYVDCPQLAELQIKAAFGDGIPRNSYMQKGYLFWQHFVPDNGYTWRVCVVDKRFAFSYIKFVNRNVPFASGDELCFTTTSLNREVEKVMDYALDFCIQNDMLCEGMDLVLDKGEPKILETHCSWGAPGSVKRLDSVVFEKKDIGWVETEYVEDTWFSLLGKEILNGRVLQTAQGQ